MIAETSPRLLIVIVRGSNRDSLVSHLQDAGYGVTTFSSIGGFLRRHSTTLLVGVSADQVDAALKLIRTTCPTPPQADEHIATIFVLRAGKFELV